MMKKFTLIILLLFVGVQFVSAQQERRLIRKGNKEFMEAFKDSSKVDSVKYAQAETFYRKALEKDPDNYQWQSNLASAILKQGHPKDAAEMIEGLVDQAPTKQDKAKLYYNLGNSHMAANDLDKAIEAYKSSLRNNPSDPAAKYNLTYAMKKKKEQEQQKKNQDKNKDKNKNKNNKDKNKDKNKNNKDKNKDKNKNNKDKNKDKNKNNKDKNKDKNNKDKNKDKNKNNKDKDKGKQQKPQKKKSGLSKSRASAMLKAMEDKEKKTQEKVRQAQVKQEKAKARSIEKKW
ncbi:tetratricopeptide repeat protein [Halosquirtibacter laminarini]|uniref:Tetratricopeptide repeat protein n=1 Tax=Halosquirtibacter laminarini TaxID=3374600 RepID=A0AC61NI02_9BACT|nr:tetratricopeptide repeat protein [Prolixibacteraceae bacterium]